MLQKKTGVPTYLKELSLELQDLIKKYNADCFSIYINDSATSYGIVWVNGKTKLLLCGIHAIIQNVAKDLGKTDEEVVKMILSSSPKIV